MRKKNDKKGGKQAQENKKNKNSMLNGKRN